MHELLSAAPCPCPSLTLCLPAALHPLPMPQWYQDLQRKMAEGITPAHLHNQLLPPPGCLPDLGQAAATAAAANPAPQQAAPPAGAALPAAVAPAPGPASRLGHAVPAAAGPVQQGGAQAGGAGGAASHLSQPATPAAPPVEQEGVSPAHLHNVDFLDFLALQAASQPAAGHKRPYGTEGAEPAKLHPVIASLLAAAERDPDWLVFDEEQQRLSASDAALPALRPTAAAGAHMALPQKRVAPGNLAPLPRAAIMRQPLSPASTAPTAVPPPTSAQPVIPPGGPAPWPGLLGPASAAGAAAAAPAGTPRIPATSPACVAGFTPAASGLLSLGAAAAGAAAGSSWPAASAGTTPTCGSLGVRAPAGRQGSSQSPYGARLQSVGKKQTANEQRVEAYADALEELVNLERVPSSDDAFAPLKTRGELNGCPHLMVRSAKCHEGGTRGMSVYCPAPLRRADTTLTVLLHPAVQSKCWRSCAGGLRTATSQASQACSSATRTSLSLCWQSWTKPRLGMAWCRRHALERGGGGSA